MLSENLANSRTGTSYLDWHQASGCRARIDDIFKIESVGLFIVETSLSTDKTNALSTDKVFTTSTDSGFSEGITFNPSNNKALRSTFIGGGIGVYYCQQENLTTHGVSTDSGRVSSFDVSVLEKYHAPRKPIRDKRQSRVETSNDGIYLYRDKPFPVNVGKGNDYGKYFIRPDVMNLVCREILSAVNLFDETLVLRFDLTAKQYTLDNKIITSFKDHLFKKPKRIYDISNTAYVWAREYERAQHKRQHYHIVLAMNASLLKEKGIKAQDLYGVIRTLYKLETSSFSDFHRAGYHFIDRINQTCQSHGGDYKPTKKVIGSGYLDEPIYHSSYLAKTRGKGHQGVGCRTFSSSNLSYKNMVAA